MNQHPRSPDHSKAPSMLDEHLRESVSALMDGEAEELELRRLLSVQHSEAVNDSWRRYHFVRDALRGDRVAINFQGLDISQQISSLIDEEPALGAGERVWLKPLAGFAVAASVAAGVIFGVQGVNQTFPGAESPAINTTALASSRVYPIVGTSLQASAGSGQQTMVNYRNTVLPGIGAASQAAAELEARQRLEKYLLRHTENAALNNGQGMISFARVANFEAQ